MTKKDLLIDETLQNLSKSERIPFTYKELRKIMDNCIIEDKLKKKQNKKNVNSNDNKLDEIYKRFVNEQLSKKIHLQVILNMWDEYRKKIVV